MKTMKIWIVMLVVISLLLVACSSKTEGSSAKVTVTDKKESAGSKIKDFLTPGAKVKCVYTIKAPDGTGTQTSTVYISGSNMRGEFTTSEQPGTIVVVGKVEGTQQCSYMWSVGVPETEGNIGNEAVKVCSSTTSEEPFLTEGSTSGNGQIVSVDWNAEASCAPYVGAIDTNVPAGYTVTDLGKELADAQADIARNSPQ